MQVAMSESPFKNPRLVPMLLLSLACAAAGTAIGWQVYLKPIRAIANRRFESHKALMRLYDLEMAYHAAHGVFANDLDTLLASAPDGPQIRAVLKATVDINTLAVVGDAERFRLEANILDEQRTAVKFRGPAAGR